MVVEICCSVETTCWSWSCLAKSCQKAAVAVWKVDEQPVFAIAEDVKRRHQGSP